MRALDRFIADQRIELTELHIEPGSDRRDVLDIRFLNIGPIAEIEPADKIRIAPGIEFHAEPGALFPASIGLAFLLQHKLRQIRSKLVRIHVKNAKLVDLIGRVIEVLRIGTFKISIES